MRQASTGKVAGERQEGEAGEADSDGAREDAERVPRVEGISEEEDEAASAGSMEVMAAGSKNLITSSRLRSKAQNQQVKHQRPKC